MKLGSGTPGSIPVLLDTVAGQSFWGVSHREQVRRQIDRYPLDDHPGVDTYQPDAVLFRRLQP